MPVYRIGIRIVCAFLLSVGLGARAEETIFVSDVDDTLKLANIPGGPREYVPNFFRLGREVAGTPELYREIALNGGRLVYLSGTVSPLGGFVNRFLQKNRFPRGEVITRPLREGTADFKYRSLVALMERHPNARFVFIGDNGQYDPAVYGKLKAHPELGARVRGIYLRQVFDRPIAPVPGVEARGFLTGADLALELAKDGLVPESAARAPLERVRDALLSREAELAFPRSAETTPAQVRAIFDSAAPEGGPLSPLHAEVRDLMAARAASVQSRRAGQCSGPFAWIAGL